MPPIWYVWRSANRGLKNRGDASDSHALGDLVDAVRGRPELRVLHVDDEPGIREIVEFSLGLEPGFVTRSCSSGQEALVVAQDWSPDIIVLDVMMPDMDGPTTLARLRDNARIADIPVVFMTARAQSREIDRFRSLGVVGVIAKPFDPITLGATVRSYIKPPDLQLDTLRNSFRQRLADDTGVLAERRLALEAGTAGTAVLEEVKSIAHGLAGTCGIFGFAYIGDAAAALEEAATLALNGKAALQDVAGALDRLLTCSRTNASRET